MTLNCLTTEIENVSEVKNASMESNGSGVILSVIFDTSLEGIVDTATESILSVLPEDFVPKNVNDQITVYATSLKIEL